ncbi:hypothetical protein LTR08_002495 [Meristemomyces frigidus]|nr:hypothetical protein LTR08_002495 [Meristemomyces frigidus]
MLPPPLLLLCSFLVLSAAGGPLRHAHGAEGTAKQQRLSLPKPKAPHTAVSQKLQSSSHLDAAPNSVGVLFTTSDDEDVGHMWLPLGKRVYTRDSPTLPLHPVTARITTMINSSPQNAAPEYLDRVVCEIHPKYNRTTENQNPEAMVIAISIREGLVRLEDAGVAHWKEVESYMCA